ncbi:hypothetical protein GTQ99_02560 [Kineococcus sp. T13]|uniref:hypothetical protein n=1 Tax=Kineococcus vitellinus TaxID=2696565 RepID=UPI0014136F4D|nr:hypothetical protein [Kineococcus vitellinus]NAZ74308.1 hypothetical protein [Kineococcus vitellinus]
MSLSAVLRDMPDRPDLVAQVLLGCPPQFLVVEGVRRTWGRELTAQEAVAHAERGRPAYLLTFGKCVELSPSLLAKVLADEDFQRSASSGEAVVRMYGRHRAGEPDTRLVVAAAARHVD